MLTIKETCVRMRRRVSESQRRCNEYASDLFRDCFNCNRVAWVTGERARLRALKCPEPNTIVYPWAVMCLFICINRAVIGETIFAGATTGCERVL